MNNVRNSTFPFLPKDFIETSEGLIFAVVSYENHEGKVGCFLRYIPMEKGWKKVTTDEANALLKSSYPQYLYHSPIIDAQFHAVALEDIACHHQPEKRLQMVLARKAEDDIEAKLHRLIPILNQFGVLTRDLGLTGSMLINQQKPSSDIDFVVYGRHAFQQVRTAIQQGIDQNLLSELDLSLMQDNYDRRASELSFEEFSWHEKRKFNKASIENTKFDIGMVEPNPEQESKLEKQHYQKLGSRQFKAVVSNAQYAFDFPAHYWVEDSETPQVISFTHTYTGQAQEGELVEVSGMVERNLANGQCRLIVGSTREAKGEYIKVVS
jgi:predicted nucleotidyltransferase